MAQIQDLEGASVQELLNVDPLRNPESLDPPYQAQLEKLSKALGSLHYLRAICADDAQLWRVHMDQLLNFENPPEDRRARLVGSFNSGYQAYARFHVRCTSSARKSMQLHLNEANIIAQDIQTRFAE